MDSVHVACVWVDLCLNFLCVCCMLMVFLLIVCCLVCVSLYLASVRHSTVCFVAVVVHCVGFIVFRWCCCSNKCFIMCVNAWVCSFIHSSIHSLNNPYFILFIHSFIAFHFVSFVLLRSVPFRCVSFRFIHAFVHTHACMRLPIDWFSILLHARCFDCVVCCSGLCLDYVLISRWSPRWYPTWFMRWSPLWPAPPDPTPQYQGAACLLKSRGAFRL